MQRRAVCFDLFHTLVDVAQVPDAVGRYTADILGLEREAWNSACFSQHHRICEATEHVEVIRALAHSLDPQIPLHLIHEAVDHRQRRFDYALQVVGDEVIAVLRALRERGLKLALISNASTAEVSGWSASPLRELFDVVLFSCHCGVAKPDPRIYRLAANRLGVEPGECWFVGDGGSDEHSGARQTGMFPVLITRFIRGRMAADALAARRGKVEQEIHRLEELLELQ